MKKYKFLEDVWSSRVETELNNLAEQGWVVKSCNVAFEGEDNSNQKIYLLLEYDDFEIDSTLNGIYERLGYISDKTGGNKSSGTDLREVHSKLSQILEQLEWISNNTSN
jgi:hypothetical protein